VTARCLSLHFRMKALRRTAISFGRRRIDHVVAVRGDLVMQAPERMRDKISELVNRAALHRHSVPDRGNGLVEPRRAIDDEELVASSRTVRQASALSPPMLLIASSTFWPGANRAQIGRVARTAIGLSAGIISLSIPKTLPERSLSMLANPVSFRPDATGP